MTRFAKGKHARSICHRCGWEYAYLEVKKEQGTNLLVCPECDDGYLNIIDNPLNKPPVDLVDNQALKKPNPDRDEIIGIQVYGETSNGFGVDYVGVTILEP